jgi:hypothetical protein
LFSFNALTCIFCDPPAISDKGLPGDDIVTVETLSGALARHCPNIYRIRGELADGDSSSFWLTQLQKQQPSLKVNSTFLHDLHGLLLHFRSRINGYVKYNPDTKSTSTNAALTYCAAAPVSKDGTVVIAAAGASTISHLKSMGVPMLSDLTKTTSIEMYNQVKGNLSMQRVSFNPPSKAHTLAGYSIFGGMATVEWPDDTTRYPDGGTTVQTVLKTMKDANPDPTSVGVAMGWGPEYQYVKVQ